MSGNDVTATRVVAVLLADGWHRTILGSFSVGALSFGAGSDPDVLGFCFEEADNGNLNRSAVLVGPLNSILAVRQGAATRRPNEMPRAAASRWNRSAGEAVA